MSSESLVVCCNQSKAASLETFGKYLFHFRNSLLYKRCSKKKQQSRQRSCFDDECFETPRVVFFMFVSSFLFVQVTSIWGCKRRSLDKRE